MFSPLLGEDIYFKGKAPYVRKQGRAIEWMERNKIHKSVNKAQVFTIK